MEEEKQIKISVVMSVYKEPVEWLRQSIDSILQQTYASFEFIIICDNPHHEDGIALLNEYAHRDKRIKLIYNKENIGLTKSLNRGLAIAQGEFIARMDADDISILERFEKQVEFMDKHPEIVASGTSAYIMQGDRLKVTHRETSHNVLWTMLAFDSPISHPSAIFRRIVDGQPVMYDETFRYSQDYALWLSFIEKHEIANIDEPLIKYRISDEQISTSSHSKQKEFALKNQQKAIKLLGIQLSEREMDVLQAITRSPEKKFNLVDVRNFVISYLIQIKSRRDMDYDKVACHLILVYANYLPKQQSIISALWELSIMSLKVRRFYYYSYLSLINKYVMKIKQ